MAIGNVWYDIWLYDPASHRYKYSKVYSEISAKDVVPGSRKLLKSYSTFRACEKEVIYYIPNGINAPIAIEKVFLEPINDGENRYCFQ